MALIFIMVLLFVTLAYFYKTISVNCNGSVGIIKVDIKGAVKAPGSYYVKKGSPIALLINKSGGLTGNAMLPENFDFSEPLYDEITIIVPRAYTFERY